MLVKAARGLTLDWCYLDFVRKCNLGTHEEFRHAKIIGGQILNKQMAQFIFKIIF